MLLVVSSSKQKKKCEAVFVKKKRERCVCAVKNTLCGEYFLAYFLAYCVQVSTQSEAVLFSKRACCWSVSAGEVRKLLLCLLVVNIEPAPLLVLVVKKRCEAKQVVYVAIFQERAFTSFDNDRIFCLTKHFKRV